MRSAGFGSLGLIATAALTLSTAVSCASTPSVRPTPTTVLSSSTAPVMVSELPATVDLVVGQSVDVVLEENRSTDYTWSTVPPLVKPGSAPIVSVAEPTYSPGEEVPGAPGESRTTVKALNPGSAVVVFRLSPPNQQPELANTKRLTVVVR